jgi:hypothetical protein
MQAIRDAAESILLGCCADLRAAVDGLDSEALLWVPAPETSPLATLVRHATSSARYLLGAAARGEADHARYSREERPDAYSGRPGDMAELNGLIDALAAEIPVLLAQTPDSGLEAVVTFNAPRDGAPPTRAWMLLHALDHMREHVGHAQLTRQMLDAGRAA